ncbi:unnamed protein product [Dicrocoelium dendriticum]|nr:unnamed protein product [Dicrocoelium dendriticum]
MSTVTTPMMENSLHHLLPNEPIIKEVDRSQESESLFVQLVDSDGNETGSPIWLPLTITPKELTDLLNRVLHQTEDRPSTYEFFVDNVQLLDDLRTTLFQYRAKLKESGENDNRLHDLESVVRVVYQAQAIFRVRPVTRCTSYLSRSQGSCIGCTVFSGRKASGNWFWRSDCPLLGPKYGIADNDRLRCSSLSGPLFGLVSRRFVLGLWLSRWLGLLMERVRRWRPSTSRNSWIRSLTWRPLHLDSDCRQLAVAYEDCFIVIWDTWTGQPLINITGHEKPVVCVRWGGTDLIYSASQDRTIRVWRSTDGVLCRTLTLHGHWVNCLALSTDYVLRTGAFDPAHAKFTKPPPPARSDTVRRAQMKTTAEELYHKVKGSGPERLVAGSDDCTLSLWQPEQDKKPLAPRMVGHQGVVNDVKFSPDARLIASASFDHSVKVWDGLTGQFLATLFGHVQDVYLVSWSSDSRLLTSCSKDSTLKLWSLAEVRRWGQEASTVPAKEKKKQIFASDVAGKVSETKAAHQRRRHLLHDLPGHADAVYALDWSPDGQYVVSGGKDRVLKIWRA